MRLRTELKLLFTIWLVYAVYATPAGGVTPNRYVDLVHSIVNEGRFAIDTYHENTIDKAYYNGHYYAGALPGPAFLAVPAYVVFKGAYTLIPQSVKTTASGVQSYQKEKQADSSFYGSVDNTEFFLSQLFLVLTVVGACSALGAVLLFKTLNLLGLETRVSLIVTYLYALGTIVFFYSTVFFEQVFSATLGIGAFYFVLRATRKENHNPSHAALVLAGFVSGCGLLVEYPTALITLWLGIWLMLSTRSWRPAADFAAGALLPLLILLAYDYALFNDPLTTPYAHLIPEFDSVHGVGFFGATYPHLDRFLGLLFGYERGLFLYMPIALIGFFGLVHEMRAHSSRSLAALACAGITISYIVFFSSYTNWRGGAAFGPRYLIAALPFVILGVAFAFNFLPKAWLYLFGALSVFVNWTGAQFGFAVTVTEHIGDLLARGPTLPAFEAILSHSSSPSSSLYQFALDFHGPFTMAATVVLLGGFLIANRDLLWNATVLRDSELREVLPENR